MPRYELSIKATYLSGWGIFDGLRELVQNARDAEVQFGAKMSVCFSERKVKGKNTGVVIINNDGCILPKEAMLIGHTSKEGDNRLIGKFGEGLKFGLLALLRMGYDIKIRNGSEVWIPEIAHSEKFNAEVLCFNVTTGNKNEKRVQFEVIGIDKGDWDGIEAKLLFLGKYPEHIETINGNILTDSEYAGKVFVKGMFVAQTNSKFGYDFKDADIDRDRRMISDLNSKTSSTLAQAINVGKLQDEVYNMMKEGLDEVSYINHWSLTDNGKKTITSAFQKENPGVIPVERAEQVRELESYGKRGKEVPWGLRGVLESTIGTAANTITALRASDKTVYSMDDLIASEQDTLLFAVRAVAKACDKLAEVIVPLDKILVVDFFRPGLLGTYNPGDGMIRLARCVLQSKGKALYTLVHEVAHTHGGDGVRAHEESIGRLMEVILDDVLSPKKSEWN